MNSAKSGAQSQKPKKPGAELLAWEAAGLHCSANERRADEASRDVEAWLKCKYMREHLGEEFAGVVTSVAAFGLFVTLDLMYVEGMIHITELGGEYFNFDEIRQELRGERTGIRYAIGTKLRVQVSRVDLDGRKIDFRLVSSDLDRPLSSASVKYSSGKSRADVSSSRPSTKKTKARTRAAQSSSPSSQDPSISAFTEHKPSAKKTLKQVLQNAVNVKASAKKKKGRKTFRVK
jgi:ribonuclease R